MVRLLPKNKEITPFLRKDTNKHQIRKAYKTTLFQKLIRVQLARLASQYFLTKSVYFKLKRQNMHLTSFTFDLPITRNFIYTLNERKIKSSYFPTFPPPSPQSEKPKTHFSCINFQYTHTLYTGKQKPERKFNLKKFTIRSSL